MKLTQLPSRHDHPTRKQPVSCFLIHTTGTSRLNEALDYYQKKFGPHYLIDWEGGAYQFVSEDQVAYHVGFNDVWEERCKKGWATWSRFVKDSDESLPETFSGYETWRKRWGERSPLDLISGASPNGRSIGIECLEPRRTQPDKFHDAQYATLAELLRGLGAKYQVPLDRQHLLGHYDATPWARCDVKGDRDPGERFNWDRLIASL